jgi:ESCRT-II complex subunit VPS22
MRRGAGIGGLIQSQQQSTQYKSVGKQLEESQVEQLRSQLSLFQSQLSSFASRYRADINANPILRYHFHTMCTSMGVDPLASSPSASSSSLFSSLFSSSGLSDFYFSLAVHIAESCSITAASNGGILSMDELLLRLRRRVSSPISASDVITAISQLACLGGGFSILTLSAGQQMIRSVPTEMNVDEMRVMQWSSSRQTGGGGGGGRGGWSTRHMEDELKWTTRRVQEVTDRLVAGGLVWVDSRAAAGGEDEYWFYSLFIEECAKAGAVTADEEKDDDLQLKQAGEVDSLNTDTKPKR